MSNPTTSNAPMTNAMMVNAMMANAMMSNNATTSYAPISNAPMNTNPIEPEELDAAGVLQLSHRQFMNYQLEIDIQKDRHEEQMTELEQLIIARDSLIEKRYDLRFLDFDKGAREGKDEVLVELEAVEQQFFLSEKIVQMEYLIDHLTEVSNGTFSLLKATEEEYARLDEQIAVLKRVTGLED